MESSSPLVPTEETVDRAPVRKQAEGGSVGKGLFIEAGMLVSMVCYYLVGNDNLGNAWLLRLNPLYSLPFLLLFILFCWYRLDFAVALFPLALLSSAAPRPLYDHYSLSLAEIILVLCASIAILQLLWQRRAWRYWLTWRELFSSLGPFTFPILLFVFAALVATLSGPHQNAAGASLRLVVLEPIIYLLLMLVCLRVRARIERVLWALFAAGCFVCLSELARVIFLNASFHDGFGGNAGEIWRRFFLGAFFPLSFAFFLIGTWQGPGALRSWLARLAGGLLCLLLVLSLYFVQSEATAIALITASLFIALFFKDRRKTVVSSLLLLPGIGAGLLFMPVPVQWRPLLNAYNIRVLDLLQHFPGNSTISFVAFSGLLVLFFWAFARTLWHLSFPSSQQDRAYMRWIIIGLGGSLIVALIQGLADPVFAEPSTWYVFWIVLGLLLLLRKLSGARWWGAFHRVGERDPGA